MHGCRPTFGCSLDSFSAGASGAHKSLYSGPGGSWDTHQMGRLQRVAWHSKRQMPSIHRLNRVVGRRGAHVHSILRQAAVQTLTFTLRNVLPHHPAAQCKSDHIEQMYI
mmetsp:Transcript_6313/g.11812  ORF Transcript_6313/g.11812 Transcript_6313/m.11812 type:complete len:109 (-) Transcript_6313:1200-1526(-)